MRFPPAAIEFGRRLNEANLPDACVRFTPGPFIPDGEGGGTYGEPTTELFYCRTSPLSAREMETLVDDQLRQPGLELLVFGVHQELAIDEEVRVTVAETGMTMRYQVKSLVPDPTFVILRRAIIKPVSEPVPEEGALS